MASPPVRALASPSMVTQGSNRAKSGRRAVMALAAVVVSIWSNASVSLFLKSFML